MKINEKLIELPEKTLWISACVLTTIVAWFSQGFHHFDEHFQIIEFMNLKIGGTKASELPWEYHKQLRPWFQPYLYYFIDWPFRSLDLSPFFRAFILRWVTAFFALYCGFIFYRRIICRHFSDFSKPILIVFLFTWYMPYINVRASSEGLSISLFLLGLAVVFDEQNLARVFGGAFILGLSYLARFQMGLPIAVFWFWGIYQRWSVKKLSSFAAAIILIFILGYFIDSQGYGETSFPLWNYFKYNFLEGVLDQMGTSPWYKYIEWAVVKPIPPISLILVCGILVFWKKYYRGKESWLTWITLSFFLFHSFIGHKEARFIFLVAYLAPLMTLVAFERRRIPNWIWVLNFILILATLKPANRVIPLYTFFYYSDIEKLYYVDEDPTKLVGLRLNFYMKDGFETEELTSDSLVGKTIFTKRYNSTQRFLENESCVKIYSNYPDFIFKIESLKKYLKKSKVMGVFKCS